MTNFIMDLARLAQYMKREGKLMYMSKIIFKIISLEDTVHFRCKMRSRAYDTNDFLTIRRYLKNKAQTY